MLYFPDEVICRDGTEALDGRYAARGRAIMMVDAVNPTVLIWNAPRSGAGGVELILCCAIESVRPLRKELSIYRGDEASPVAVVEVIGADPYQIIPVRLPLDIIPATGPLTLRLQTTDGGPLWLYAPDAKATGGMEYHLPRLSYDLTGHGPFMDRLVSLASLQTFSWKEGCVLDALGEMARSGSAPAAAMIRAHLDTFGFSTGDLVYESPRNHRLVNTFSSIETTLPLAEIARIDPRHPWVELVIAFWQKLMDENGEVYHDEMISSEGAYTVAYPMTVIGRLRGEPKWEAAAERLLVETFTRLVQPDGIYLRHYSDGRLTHRNWARGLAWLLLGHVQTLRDQAGPSARLREQLHVLMEFVLKHQLPNGLWACFVHEPDVAPDTAGSSGIAAALALGARESYLPARAGEAARRAYEELKRNLTPEGFLAGCSQSNKAGEDLQRGPYRVITPYALGMLGLLEGVCGEG